MTRSLTAHLWRTPVRAAVPGTLEAAAGLLDLPDMTPVVGATDPGEPDPSPRAWRTTQPVADRQTTWRCWARGFDRTGLWPLLPGGVDWTRSLAPAAAPEDAATVLSASWQGCTPVLPDGTLLPHPPWPGLAPGRGAPDDRGVLLPPEVIPPLAGELLLVPAQRPADAPARLGWYGAVNWCLSGAAIAGVLRSWEERFGAYLVGMGVASLDLVVTRPPATARQIDLLAHEHFAFCPDNFFPQNWPPEPPIPHEVYAARLRTATRWHFWWD
jgi:hypothetical protein